MTKLGARRSIQARERDGDAGARRRDGAGPGDDRAPPVRHRPRCTSSGSDALQAGGPAARRRSCATGASTSAGALLPALRRCRVPFGDVTAEERRRVRPGASSGLLDRGRRDRPGAGLARPGRSAAGRVGFRDGAARRREATARARARRSRADAAPTRTRPDGFLLAYGAAVEPRAPDRARRSWTSCPTLLYFLGLPVGARHGRLRAHRYLPAVVRRIAADHVHPDLRTLARRAADGQAVHGSCYTRRVL